MKLREDISDSEIVRLYKSTQDQKHLALLFERYKSMIYGVCLKYYKNAEDARDGMMEIYEKSVSKLITHQVENFRAWVYVMTKNHCLEKIRKLKTHELKESELKNMYSDALLHLDNERTEVLMVKLDDCIDKLKQEHSICVKAFYYQKLTYHQIAEQFDMSWNSVRSYIQNARRKLKQCIDKS